MALYNIGVFSSSLGVKVSGIEPETIQFEKDAEVKCFWSVSHQPYASRRGSVCGGA